VTASVKSQDVEAGLAACIPARILRPGNDCEVLSAIPRAVLRDDGFPAEPAATWAVEDWPSAGASDWAPDEASGPPCDAASGLLSPGSSVFRARCPPVLSVVRAPAVSVFLKRLSWAGPSALTGPARPVLRWGVLLAIVLPPESIDFAVATCGCTSSRLDTASERAAAACCKCCENELLDSPLASVLRISGITPVGESPATCIGIEFMASAAEIIAFAPPEPTKASVSGLNRAFIVAYHFHNARSDRLYGRQLP
jgi:hypothetical protein